MAHFALVCPDDAGHLLPVGAVGSELVRRGHRVTLLAGEKAAPIAKQLDLSHRVMPWDEVPRRTSHLMLLAFGHLRERMEDRPAQTCSVGEPKRSCGWCRPSSRSWRVDGVIVDQTLPAAGTAADHLGLPFVTACSALMWNEETDVPPPFTPWGYAEDRRARRRNRLGYASWHWYIRPVLGVVNRYRKAWNLRPWPRSTRATRRWPRCRNYAPSSIFRGGNCPRRSITSARWPTPARSATISQFPWDRLDGRPLVFASLGTVPYRSNLPVFRKILAACAGLDVQLVLALGKLERRGRQIRARATGPYPR